MFLQQVQKPHKKSPLDTNFKAFLLHSFNGIATKIDEAFSNNLMNRTLLLSKLGLKSGVDSLLVTDNVTATDTEQVKDLTTFVDFKYSNQQRIWSNQNNKNMFAQCATEKVIDC